MTQLRGTKTPCGFIIKHLTAEIMEHKLEQKKEALHALKIHKQKCACGCESMRHGHPNTAAFVKSLN